jgi:TolA-binding protein
MATTNYSLPTLESTALFDLVTDYNALANATDAALASVAELIPTETITEMQGQISALQTLTGSQGTQITTLQSQVSSANGNISTLQSGLETANGNIGTLQTGLQSANQNIQAINELMKPFILISGLNVQTSNARITGNVFCNAAAKILVFSVNASITYNFTRGSAPTISAFTQVLPAEYRPTQNRRIFVGDAMSGTAACNLQLDINAETGAITPNVGGINNVEAFTVNGNAILMYDIPVDANNS